MLINKLKNYGNLYINSLSLKKFTFCIALKKNFDSLCNLM